MQPEWQIIVRLMYRACNELYNRRPMTRQVSSDLRLYFVLLLLFLSKSCNIACSCRDYEDDDNVIIRNKLYH